MGAAVAREERTALAEHRQRGVRLAHGEVLPELVTAYVTLGKLDAERSNAVLVLHGYTTGPSMLDAASNAAEGSWSGLVGPGRAIDTNRWFVICPNMLGSSYGSTGPASIDPRTGKPYGLSFPRIDVGDIVDAQKSMIDSMGITRLAAVVGPSLGAMQAFMWGTRYPERVARVVAAVGAPHHPALLDSAKVLEQLAGDPGWHDGRYYDHPGSMIPCLTKMRLATLERYGIDAELASRWPDPAARRDEIGRLAAEWAQEFDPISLYVLARAVEGFDVRGDLARMTSPLLYVLSRTDAGFPPSLARELAPAFDAAGLRWTYFELDSEKGHLASGADSHLWADTLARFMEA
jgi:homoserine O-acetyltransferase/O-succinyltransferase